MSHNLRRVQHYDHLVRLLIIWLTLLTLIPVLEPPPAGASPGILTPTDPLLVGPEYGVNSTCTLGFLFVGSDGYARGLTAAHCGNPGDAVTTISGSEVGEIAEHGREDVALIDIQPDLRAFGSIPGAGDVRGVITPRELNRTQPLLCKRGISSGMTCGTLTAPASEEFFTISGGSVSGDSGSPVWAISKDGSLFAAGIVSGVVNDGSEDAYVIPIHQYMKQWSLTIYG